MSSDYDDTTPKPFKRRKNHVEAMRVTAENAKAVAKWCGGESFRNDGGGYISPENKPLLEIPTLSMERPTACHGDWVIKDEDGRFSVMDKKTFKDEFESEGGNTNVFEEAESRESKGAY